MHLTVKAQVELLYKQHYGQLLAVLVRIVAPQNLQYAEDMLQEAFHKALINWNEKGIPENPKGWLIKTAKNKLIDQIRHGQIQSKLNQEVQNIMLSNWTSSLTLNHAFNEEAINDDLLKMVFMCCDPQLKLANQLPFILNTLCGLKISSISRALLIPVETVKKRLVRVKKTLSDHDFKLPDDENLPEALFRVQTCLYLLFNEGYYSASSDTLQNPILCIEAYNLVLQINESNRFRERGNLSLLALFNFLRSRAHTRIDSNNEIVPLNLQNRANWDKTQIDQGREWLKQAKRSKTLSNDKFYIEAQIAEQHSIACDFNDTDWVKIVSLYQQLIVEHDNSTMIQLNLAIALSYSGQPTTAKQILLYLAQDPQLSKTHFPDAALAHVYAQLGDQKRAYQYAHLAQKKGGTEKEHQAIRAQIEYWLNIQCS